MMRYQSSGELATRYWADESVGVVRRQASGTTHLVSSAALAVLQVVQQSPHPIDVHAMAQALELGPDDGSEAQSGLQRLIDGLVQSGLLLCADEHSHAG